MLLMTNYKTYINSIRYRNLIFAATHDHDLSLNHRLNHMIKHYDEI